MLKRTIVIIATALVVAAPAATAAAKTKPAAYRGKTREGSKISFVVDRGWVEGLTTLLPTTCISAQGGTPHVVFTDWSIPYKFKLGYAAKVDYGDPTKHYHITTHRAGNRVSGKLSINYSQLDTDGFGNYIIDTCLATANFDLRPH